MILITNLKIDNFRSILSQELQIREGYLPIIGPNNSGKSNIIRALNLFFNDEIESGDKINLKRDFHNPRSKRKKQISISVSFNLPPYFNFHRKIADGLNDLLGNNFTIKKMWSFDRTLERIVLNISICKQGQEWQDVKADDRERVSQFLNLIRFRYQPNHIHPSKIIDQVQPELQAALVTRIKKRRGSDYQQLDNVFIQMESLAAELVGPISPELVGSATSLEEFELSASGGFARELFHFIPLLKVIGGEKFSASMHGSGVQSYLSYLILAFLDSRFSASFGWHQATIWAVEEPESFLHHSLQHKVAEYVSQLANRERFQIFCTTHSEVFGGYAAEGLLCRLKQGKTIWNKFYSRTLSEKAAIRGVTAYVHPLHFGIQKPLLLVEGPTDTIYFKIAFRIFNRLNPWEIWDIPSLDPDSQLTGVDGLERYLKDNHGALVIRPLLSPIIVVVDWNENRRTVSRLENITSQHLTSKVAQWPENFSNPQLGQTFTGIERYLGIDLIRNGADRGIMNLRRPARGEYPLNTDRSSLRKSELAELAQERSEPDDFQYFSNFLDQLDDILKATMIEGERIIQNELTGRLQQEIDI